MTREENRFFRNVARHRRVARNNTDVWPIIVIIALSRYSRLYIRAAQRFIAFERIDATPQLG